MIYIFETICSSSKTVISLTIISAEPTNTQGQTFSNILSIFSLSLSLLPQVQKFKLCEEAEKELGLTKEK